MIEVEIEDAAWTAALSDAQAVVLQAAKPTLSCPSCEERLCKGAAAQGGPISAFAAPPSGPSRKRADSLTILLTDDETVRRLNADFRGKDAPTNVLSFPAPPTAAPHLGDIALAYGVCAREAAAQDKPLAHHLMHLTAHGVLHLLGYDHQSDAEAEVMEGVERAILAGLGVPDPYAPTSYPPDSPALDPSPLEKADVPL